MARGSRGFRQESRRLAVYNMADRKVRSVVYTILDAFFNYNTPTVYPVVHLDTQNAIKKMDHSHFIGKLLYSRRINKWRMTLNFGFSFGFGFIYVEVNYIYRFAVSLLTIFFTNISP